MFKVECLGCQAPYQVDERRVPATGLQMRCPKCGTSFKVEAPGSENAGVAGESSAKPKGAFAPMAVTPEVRSPGSASREALSRTMIGVSTAGAKAAKAPFRMPRPNQPVTTGQSDSADTPRVAVEPPALAFQQSAELPDVLATKATGQVLPPVEQATQELLDREKVRSPADDDSLAPESLEVDALESLALNSRPFRQSDLPVPFDKGQSSELESRALGEEPDDQLPTVKEPTGGMGELPALPTRAELPMPAPRKPPPRRPRPARPVRAGVPRPDLLEESKLEAGAELSEDLPAPVQEQEAGVVDMDLPDLRGASLPEVKGQGEATLPRAVVGFDDLPNVLGAKASEEALLPAARQPEAALPSVAAEVALPTVSSGRQAAMDLPSVLGDAVVEAALPSVLGGQAQGFGRVALPQVVEGVARVPASHSTEDGALPELAASLPAVGGGLPEVASSLPAAAGGLPEVGASLPTVGAALPEISSPLPAASESLPDVAPSSLPTVQGVLPSILGGEPEHAEVADPFGAEANQPGPAASGPGDSGESFGALADFSFSDTGSGATANLSFPPDGEPFGDSVDLLGGDPFGAAQLDHGSVEEPQEADFGSEASFSSAAPSETPADDAGPAQYGEVNIPSNAPEADPVLETMDDMEFSGLPQQEAGSSDDVPEELADVDSSGATLEMDAPREAPVRKLERRVAIAAALALGVIGGGAMSLEPRLGPFGIYFVMDEVQRSDNEKSLFTLVREAQQDFGRDTLTAARAAISRAEQQAQIAPRFDDFRAHLAVVLHTTALRFGPLPETEALGKAALGGVPSEAEGPLPSLARASALAANLDSSAVSLLEKLKGEPGAQTLLAELLVQLQRPEEALAVLGDTNKRQTAAEHFVAARAQLAQGRWRQGFDEAAAALLLEPDHVGAAIARLDAKRQAQQQRTTEAEHPASAALTIDALTSAMNQRLERGAPAEKSLAHEVMGDLALKHGRASQAQEQFEAALAIKRNSPRALVGLGQTLLAAGRYAEALARLEAAAASRPKDLAIRLSIVEAQLALEQLGQANDLVESLLKTHPENAQVVYWQGRTKQALHEPEGALAAYRSSIALGGAKAESVHAYLALAAVQEQLGQTVASRQTLEEAREKLPPSGLLLHALGRTSMKEGKYPVALATFQRALALDPQDTRARFLVAVTLARLGRYSEATTQFDSVAAQEGAFPGLAMERGRLLEVSGNTSKALEQYEQALKAEPDSEELRLRVGCARVVTNAAESAVEVLEEVVKSQPRSAEAHYCLGRAHFQLGQQIQALSLLDKAVAMDDSQPLYHLYRGWVSLEVGKASKALASFGAAIELDTGLGDAYWLRGKLRRKQGAVKDAIKDLRRALVLDSGRAEVLADLASAYSDLGNRKRALKAWSQAVDREPEQATWRFRYGKLLSSAGHTAKAASQLSRALELAQPQGVGAGRRTEPSEAWIPQAHYLLARSLGSNQRAVEHWQAFLSASRIDNPYRGEAKRGLQGLGVPWEGR